MPGAQIEEIMTADDMKFAISTFEAMNLSKEVKPALKKTQAQTLLDSYVAKGDSLHPASVLPGHTVQAGYIEAVEAAIPYRYGL